MEKTDFDGILDGLNEALEHAQGKRKLKSYRVEIEVPDVKAIRAKTKLTQKEFSRVFGFSVDAISSWEQGRRIPDHSARALLLLIKDDPTHVLEVMASNTQELIAAE